MTSPAGPHATGSRDGFVGFATGVARLVVASHVAPFLPEGHPWRLWSTSDVTEPRPWPVAELAPACVVSVSAAVGPALNELAATAETDGLRVQRYQDAAGLPACMIAAERFDGDEMMLETLRVLGWRGLGVLTGGRLDAGAKALDLLGAWPFPLPVAFVTGQPVDGVGCVLHVKVECAGTPHGALRRRLPSVLATFVARSAAHDVSVAVGPWVSHRPPPVVHLGRRRRRRPAA